MSSITFDPFTDEELTQKQKVAVALLEPGIANFEIKVCILNKSKSSNNDQFFLTLAVWDVNGKEGTIFDYIPLTPDLRWKLASICKAVVLTEKLKTGKLSESDFAGKCGKCKIKIEKSEQYGEQNKIHYYIEDDGSPKKDAVAEVDKELNDDVPF